MARDPEAIQQEIEQARMALAESLDALTDKASPRRLVEGGKQTVLEKLSDPKVKYGLIAFGALVVLLIVRRIFR